MVVGFRDVEPLLSPQSIAIVGMQADPTSWGWRVNRELGRHGFEGGISFVSHRHDEIDGKRAFRDLGAVPVAPDHVIAIASAARTIDVLEEAGARGARSATVFAAGYGEHGTAESSELEQRLRAVVEKYDIAVCGPNCMGFISLPSGMSSFAERYPTKVIPGSFGLVSQSGGMMGAIIRHATERGVGFSHAISTGNELSRDVADFIHFMAQDPKTRVIGVVLEGVRRPAEFVAACEEALEVGKPLILIQSGRTERGQDAVTSHTGVLAANGATMDAVVERLGIMRVDSVAEFIELAELSTRWGVPPEGGLAVIALSGGARNMIIDVEDEFGLPLATLSEGTLSTLHELLPIGTTIDNPLDIGLVGLTPSLRETYLDALRAVLSDPAVSSLAIQEELPRTVDASAHLRSLTELTAVAASYGKPLAFFSRANYAMGNAEHEAHSAIDAPFLQDVHESMRAMGRLLGYHRRRPDLLALERYGTLLHRDAAVDSAAEGVAVEDAIAYRRLRDHGVPIPAFEVIEPGAGGTYAGTWPVVLKIIAEGIEHKSDIGGVTVGIQSQEELDAEIVRMRKRVGDEHPLLVQQMVERGKLEIFLSCYRDASFGWMMLIGLGGLWAEPLATFTAAVLPRTLAQAERTIDQSVIGRILRSPRGGLILDGRAVAPAVLALAETALDPAWALRRIEINPLILGDAGAVAVDIVMEENR